MRDFFEDYKETIFAIVVVAALITFLILVIKLWDTSLDKQHAEYVNFEHVAGEVYVDTTTGVLYYQRHYGLSPLYNADGTLKLYVEENK